MKNYLSQWLKRDFINQKGRKQDTKTHSRKEEQYKGVGKIDNRFIEADIAIKYRMIKRLKGTELITEVLVKQW